MNISDYKGVWVFAEQRNGELQKVALELLGKGKELATTLGVELTALLLGHNVDDMAKSCLAHGADKVVAVDNAALAQYTTATYTKAIVELVNDRKPEVLILGATNIGRDLGPRISARLETGLTADCTALDIHDEEKYLLMTRPAFGGNLMATIKCTKTRPQMSTVRPGVFAMVEADESNVDLAKVEKVAVEFPADVADVKVIEVVKHLKEILDISEAEVLVSGGRGVGSKENFALLQQLADVMGGVVCGSRPAIESGWIDKNLQVGQTGKTVKPKIYIACGISGSIQHLAGMSDSEYIIAINKDPEALITTVADLTLVGDLNKVIPQLIEQFSSMEA